MFLWNFLSVLSTYKSNQTFLATFRSLSLSYLDKICFLASVRLYLLKLWTIVFKPLFYKCLSTWKFVQKKAQVFFLLHSLCYSTVFHRQIDIFFSLSTVSISHKKEISFRNKKYAVFALIISRTSKRRKISKNWCYFRNYINWTLQHHTTVSVQRLVWTTRSPLVVAASVFVAASQKQFWFWQPTSDPSG